MVLVEKGKLVLMPDVMPDAPADDEVQLKNLYCGVCGSDVEYWKNGGIGRTVVHYPFILGHEWTAEVIAVGKDVDNVKVGDVVVMEPGVGCGKCVYCMTGRYNLCKKMRFMATPPIDGSFRRYMNYPARACFKLPENVSARDAAMIEPLNVGMWGAERGEVDNSKICLITGSGCIGLMTLLACKARNAQKIIVSDIQDIRLKKAKELGADEVINAAKEDVLERVRELTDGEGADVVLDAAGSVITEQQNVYNVRRGGVIVQIGITDKPVPYQFNELAKIEADIRTTHRYRNLFPLAIKLIANGSIDIARISPSMFDFRDAQKAFETAVNEADKVVKCMLQF